MDNSLMPSCWNNNIIISTHDKLNVVDEQNSLLTDSQLNELNEAISRIPSNALRLKLSMLLHDYQRMSICTSTTTSAALQSKMTVPNLESRDKLHEEDDSPLTEVRTWASSIAKTKSFPFSGHQHRLMQAVAKEVDVPQKAQMKRTKGMLNGLKNLQENVAKINEAFSEASQSFESYFTTSNDYSPRTAECSLSTNLVEKKREAPHIAFDTHEQVSAYELMTAIQKLENRFEYQRQTVSSLFQKLSEADTRNASLGKELKSARDYLTRKDEHQTNLERIQRNWKRFQAKIFQDVVACANSLFPFVIQLRDLESRSSCFAISMIWALETLQKIELEKDAKPGRFALAENQKEINFINSYKTAGVTNVAEKVVNSIHTTLRVLRDQSERLRKKEEQELADDNGKSLSFGKDISKVKRDGRIRLDFLQLKRNIGGDHPNALMAITRVMNRMTIEFNRLLCVFRHREMQTNVMLDNVNSMSLMVASCLGGSSNDIGHNRWKTGLSRFRERQLQNPYGLLSKYNRECQINCNSTESLAENETMGDNAEDQKEILMPSPSPVVDFDAMIIESVKSSMTILPDIACCDFDRWDTEHGFNGSNKNKATCRQMYAEPESSSTDILRSGLNWRHIEKRDDKELFK